MVSPIRRSISSIIRAYAVVHIKNISLSTLSAKRKSTVHRSIPYNTIEAKKIPLIFLNPHNNEISVRNAPAKKRKNLSEPSGVSSGPKSLKKPIHMTDINKNMLPST